METESEVKSRKRRQTSGSPLVFIVDRNRPSGQRLFTVEQNAPERYLVHNVDINILSSPTPPHLDPLYFKF